MSQFTPEAISPGDCRSSRSPSTTRLVPAESRLRIKVPGPGCLGPGVVPRLTFQPPVPAQESALGVHESPGGPANPRRAWRNAW